MRTLNIFILALIGSLFTTILPAQTNTGKESASAESVDKTTSFQVLGNCGMCQRKIEKAALGAGATSASWDVDTDILTITYDPSGTSVDAVQKAIALVGYDNAGYKAPDDIYNNLHGCCQYDRSGAPSTAKPCTPEGEQDHK
ncbi:MAG: heavy-metal-associated domain-containing protein [Bacteroidetes bacterium]|nr:MAG: heavy-metal-associated domain-containing protein [Bacteroidota bacterium]